MNRRQFQKTSADAALRIGCAALLALCTACGGGSASPDPATSSGSVSPPSGATAAAWKPGVADTWQWQLRGTVNTTYDVRIYDVDLFDTPQATIAALQAAGRHVICYFSAGSSEDWRPDYSKFLASDKGNALSGWPGEQWLDTRSDNVRAVMRARLDLAVSKRCDGVEPDNVDGYTNNPGFPLDASTQIDFNRFIASEAHARGLAVGLKNDIDQIPDLVAAFDFAVNEQCHEFSECGAYAAFTGGGKPVFNAEYLQADVTDSAARANLCMQARAANLRTLVLPLQLDDSFRYSCDS